MNVMHTPLEHKRLFIPVISTFIELPLISVVVPFYVQQSPANPFSEYNFQATKSSNFCTAVTRATVQSLSAFLIVIFVAPNADKILTKFPEAPELDNIFRLLLTLRLQVMR
ncbi:hypothetical protein BWQ96_10314 [Gracilariopsis chorda]|uniref:Uncharacterized protein n=1 Tax=Gracilariopsis chorda TaxID=448386 RepID=A0A2V3ID01_9FLOR|nr:hypothetical protein BWQ96_10717 [Gracilariopsis chorda]PXF39963.1 hypothetical protein BWQ96_10314 [Gracilariopsis chorda]|eukprot:PXF39586.1 hypothetical protein BWQ96_10717 [Gracilariopsis chorda]